MIRKILIVFGTRPEAIKLVPIIKRLKSSPEFNVKICISAQHRDMLDSVLNSYNIVPDYDLSIMKDRQTLFYITSEILSRLEKILNEFNPDVVLVHGDTTTAYSAALAAFYKGIKIGHVEAGLRSKNIYSPFPEEFNRRCISLISDFHFAPTEICKTNLISEGVAKEKIFVVGNTVIDILKENLQSTNELLCPYENYAILTVHRREHSSKELSEIFEAIKEVCFSYPEFCIFYPVHKSPRVASIAKEVLSDVPNVILSEPLEVRSFHNLLSKCRFVITDSGGIQEEASFLGKPTLILRENTERPEASLYGTTRLIGCNKCDMVKEISQLISCEEVYKKMAHPCDCFGNGDAAEKIIDVLKKY